MTETIKWDSSDAEKDDLKKRVLIETPVTETTTLGRIDEEIAMLDREMEHISARRESLVSKRATIASALSIEETIAEKI